MFSLRSEEVTAPHYGQFSTLDEGVAILKAVARNRNYQLFACTNWSNEIVEQLKREHPEILAYFKAVITPTIAQARKPQSEIFRYLLDTYMLEEQDCLFIDDQESNVQGAQAVNIDAIHVSDFAHLKNELIRFGIYEPPFEE